MSSIMMVCILFLKAKLRNMSMIFPGPFVVKYDKAAKLLVVFYFISSEKNVELMAFCKLCICFKMPYFHSCRQISKMEEQELSCRWCFSAPFSGWKNDSFSLT